MRPSTFWYIWLHTALLPPHHSTRDQWAASLMGSLSIRQSGWIKRSVCGGDVAKVPQKLVPHLDILDPAIALAL